MGRENLLRETNGGETSPHTSQDLPPFMTLVEPRSSLVSVEERGFLQDRSLFVGAGEKQERPCRSCFSRTSGRCTARWSSYLPFLGARLEEGAFFAGAGAFAASDSSDPAVKLTRFPAGR